MATFVLDKTENIVGKEENAGYQHFLLFPQCFQKAISLGSLKARIVWERVKGLPNYFKKTYDIWLHNDSLCLILWNTF